MGAILGDSFKTIRLSSLISSSEYASARTVKSALSTPADVSTTAGTKCLLFTVSKYLNFFPLCSICWSKSYVPRSAIPSNSDQPKSNLYSTSKHADE